MPDLVIWLTGVFPVTTGTGIVSLMIMHLVAATCAVGVDRRGSPEDAWPWLEVPRGPGADVNRSKRSSLTGPSILLCPPPHPVAGRLEWLTTSRSPAQQVERGGEAGGDFRWTDTTRKAKKGTHGRGRECE